MFTKRLALKKVISILCSLAMVIALCAACGQSAPNAVTTTAAAATENVTTAAATTAAAAAEATTAASTAAATTTAVTEGIITITTTAKSTDATNAEAGSDGPEPIQFPLFDEVTEMTVFWALNAKATVSMKDYSEMRLTEELERMTNVRLVFVHPPLGQEGEAFNLMRATGDFPDLVFYLSWLGMSGGPQKALDDGFLMPMNDLMGKYAPNLTKLLEVDEIRRFVSTDDGVLYVFPMLRYNQSMKSVWGMMTRMDWVEKLGLEVPKTIDELEQMLILFRDSDLDGTGQKIYPLTSTSGTPNVFFWPWGIQSGFVNVDGKAVYGPYSDEYRDAITTLARWYADGLIDPEYTNNDTRMFEERVTSGISALFYSEAGGSMGLVNKFFEDNGHPEYRVAGIPVPTKDGSPGYNYAGDQIYQGGGIALTTNCRYPVEATKLFDWGYSAEGDLMWNFGIEGESYTMVNGRPQLTDYILNNPDGLTIDQALARFTYGSMSGPFSFSSEVRDQRLMFYDWQRESIANWNKDLYARTWPSAIFTVEENQRHTEIMADIGTYVDECRTQFINGTMPISELDNYMAQLKSMGIEEAIALRQASLDRFYARN